MLALHVLKFCSMGVHLGSRDLLKFCEISANISETVQDRHVVTVWDITSVLSNGTNIDDLSAL